MIQYHCDRCNTDMMSALENEPPSLFFTQYLGLGYLPYTPLPVLPTGVLRRETSVMCMAVVGTMESKQTGVKGKYKQVDPQMKDMQKKRGSSSPTMSQRLLAQSATFSLLQMNAAPM